MLPRSHWRYVRRHLRPIPSLCSAPTRPSERRHWAFRPRAHPEVPQFSDAADRQGAATPIDGFILARLQKESLHPSTLLIA